MKISILDASTLGYDLDLSFFNELGEVAIFDLTQNCDVSQNIGDAEVVIVNKVKLNADNLSDCKNLKLICVTATGYDNISLDYCKGNKIAVCNVAAYSTNSVAQITVSMALSLVSHLNEYVDYVKDGSYTLSGLHNYLKPTYHEIAGMKWGVVGLGNIGRGVARVAKALGCDVLACKRTPDEEFECVDIDTLCSQADIISIHLPLSKQTEHLINAERLSLMKPSAILINMGRGNVWDEEAVTAAFENGNISGLGIDVYSEEPMNKNHPFNRIMQNKCVLLTPHMAWGAYESRVRCMKEVKENIISFYKDQKRNRIL